MLAGLTVHPRNLHLNGIDFALLTSESPALASHVFTNDWGTATIDFANPEAVKSLSAALLRTHYGVANWDLPHGYLCPAIPGRADYLHGIADLLATSHGGVIPRGESVRMLDIGVGASCVYPLIGHAAYGWRFVGTDIDPAAIAAAKQILSRNPGLERAIEVRLQKTSSKMLAGVLNGDERFHASMSNPPFHTSASEAAAGSRRKWRNLGKGGAKLNFGGQARELWFPGGELAFIQTLIDESAQDPQRCIWFSTLVSKSANLPAVHRAIRRVHAQALETVEMKQGQKTSRFVAWTFLTQHERSERIQ